MYPRRAGLYLQLTIVVLLSLILLHLHWQHDTSDGRRINLLDNAYVERHLAKQIYENGKEHAKAELAFDDVIFRPVNVDFRCDDSKPETFDCVPGRKLFQSKYRVSQKYGVSACVIEKSMSTMMTGVMCFLSDETAFKKAGREIAKETYENRFCKDRNEHASWLKLERVRSGNWSHVAVVRDPLDRFVSGFVDKCVLEKKVPFDGIRCYGCGRSMKCFLEKQFQRAKDYATGMRSEISYGDIHFFPQNWRCNFAKSFDKYTIVKQMKTQPAKEQQVGKLVDVLKKRNVDATSLQAVRSALLSNFSMHSTRGKPERSYYERLLRSDRHMMNLLIKMYYYDYTTFHFPFPKVAAAPRPKSKQSAVRKAAAQSVRKQKAPAQQKSGRR